MDEYRLPAVAQLCGSDLCALRPRQLLGCYLGARGRHMKDIGNDKEADRDYLLARHLFPENRTLYCAGTWVTIRQSSMRFDPSEPGSLLNLAHNLQEVYSFTRLSEIPLAQQGTPNYLGVVYVQQFPTDEQEKEGCTHVLGR